MAHSTSSSTSTTTQTPITGQDFQGVLQQLLDQLTEFTPFNPADLFDQLSEGSPFLEQLTNALSKSFEPFVEAQLNSVGDLFRSTGNEGAASGQGGPNRLTQVAIPQALASINQQFGGQLTNLVSSALGDLLGANQLQQQGQLSLIDQIRGTLGIIPTGSQTTQVSNRVQSGGGVGGARGSTANLNSIFQPFGGGGAGSFSGNLGPKPQFDPFRLQNTPGSPFFINRSPRTGPGPNRSGASV